MTLLITSLLSTLSMSLHAQSDIKPKDFKVFKERHLAFLKVLMEHEKQISYPTKILKEGTEEEVSLYEHIYDLNELFIKPAYAANNNLCFFGGWPSFRKKGKCKPPWKYKKSSELAQYGLTYGSNAFCGGDNLFRCNPTLFGHAPEGKGLCLKVSSYNNLTQKCYEATIGSLESTYERYKNDDSFRTHYDALGKTIISFCNDENNQSYSACEHLVQRLSDLHEKYCKKDSLFDIIDEKKVLALQAINQKITDILKPKVKAVQRTVRNFSKCAIPGTTLGWQKKCLALYRSNIPKPALDYALKVLKYNATSFKTSACFGKKGIKGSDHPSMVDTNKDDIKNLFSNGYKNKCQMIINNVDDRSLSPQPSGWDNCRGRMYYVDLCSGDQPVVTEDYFNLGTGSCRGKTSHRNRSNSNTTVLGAFFTHNKTFDFRHTATRKQVKRYYNNVASKVKGLGGRKEATALHLFGLQNTNNRASVDGKYIHVSPHRSSWGCPSIKPENYHMIQKLADNGPSLVLNWSSKGMEDIEKCNSLAPTKSKRPRLRKEDESLPDVSKD